jgi:branched-chain amino acid transport system substrate-binding protein
LTAARRAPRAIVVALVIASSACGSAAQPSPMPGPLRIGAIFPLGSSSQADAGNELLGVRIAAELVNAQGGVHGRRIELDVRDVDTVADAAKAAASLRSDHVPAVIGAYSSSLSIAASSAVAAAGMVYWEAGAVADRLTGRGLPLVFRVGANGADLGGNSARFVVGQLAPLLHREARRLRVFLVTADDAYAHSVADGARAVLASLGVTAVSEAVYDPYAPYWPEVLNSIAAAAPDVLLLSSHVPDGVSFRRAFLATSLRVGAFVGTTMAQCPPTFGSELGSQAVGVFASDRPDPDNPFDSRVLSPAASTLFGRFAAAWRRGAGFSATSEGLAGFTAAWALFAETLPRAASITSQAVAAAARSLELPAGSLPDGAGVAFASSGAQLGQNLRASAVVEQWQSPTSAPVVWPPGFATAGIEMPAAA